MITIKHRYGQNNLFYAIGIMVSIKSTEKKKTSKTNQDLLLNKSYLRSEVWS